MECMRSNPEGGGPGPNFVDEVKEITKTRQIRGRQKNHLREGITAKTIHQTVRELDVGAYSNPGKEKDRLRLVGNLS